MTPDMSLSNALSTVRHVVRLYRNRLDVYSIARRAVLDRIQKPCLPKGWRLLIEEVIDSEIAEMERPR